MLKTILCSICLVSLLSGYADAESRAITITGAPIIPLALPAGPYTEVDGTLFINGLLYFPDGTSQTTASPWARNSSNASFTGGNVGIGTPVPGARLDVVVDDFYGSSLQLWSDETWTGMKTTNSNGLMRYRGSLEVWPYTTNGLTGGRLDVRDTGGNATIVLDGSTGKVMSKNMPAVQSIQVGKNTRNNNAATYLIPPNNAQDVDSISVNVLSDGYLLILATLDAEVTTSGGLNAVYRSDLYFKLDETTGGNSTYLVEQKLSAEVSAGIMSNDFSNAGVISIQWVLPTTAGVRSFKTSVFAPVGFAHFWTSTLKALFIPASL